MAGGGVKLPILIANSVKVKGLKRGKIVVDKISTGSICIGFGGTKGISANKHGFLMIGKDSRIIFEGTASFGAGTSIRVDNGSLRVGTGFCGNKNCFFSCTDKIVIGEDVLLGWNVTIRDSDGHTVYRYNEVKPNMKPVKIGKHVWIASFSDVLKGVHIPDNCIVGYRSCVLEEFTEKNCLIAGYPAKVLQKNICWKK